MSANDPELDRMIRELAALPPAERDAVLDLVGDDAAALIAPRLKDLSEARLSDKLRALIDQARTSTPAGMTDTAASALRRISQAAMGSASPAVMPERAATGGTFRRLLARAPGGVR